MAFYERIIALIESQIGYHEGHDNSGWNNDQKYSKETPGFGWSNWQAWCGTMQSWVDYKVGLTKGAGDNANSPCTASVLEAYQWGKRKGRFTEYPVLGAWAIFRKSEHTERVVGFNDTHVFTIGGNTISQSGGYSSQGNGVYRKSYLRTEARITGYVVPIFPDGVYVSPDPKWNTAGHKVNAPIAMPTTATATPRTIRQLGLDASGQPRPISYAVYLQSVKSGKASGNVLVVQRLLKAQGTRFYAGALDGIYGPKTRSGIKEWQEAIGDRGSDADGNLGPAQFSRLVAWGGFRKVA